MTKIEPCLDGRGAIAARLSELLGFNVSVDQVSRWAARADDPLPLERVGRMGRKRVISRVRLLEAWARREMST